MASPPGSSVSIEDLHRAYNFVVAFFALICYGVFSVLVWLDVWRAFKKRATWLPGKAFSLSAATVQIIVWWTSLGKLFKNTDEDYKVLLYAYLHQIVVSGRVAVCVFVGYLLPEMSAPSVRAFVTLGTAICLQIASELVIFNQGKTLTKISDEGKKIIKNWAPLVDKIILICIIVLGLILGCTALAIKNIRGLLTQRISAIFSISEEGQFHFSDKKAMSWNDFEDNVLGSWFVARVCRPDYVISRSVLSSAVGIIVTICVIFSILSNTFHNRFFSNWNDPYICIFVPLFSFIMTGWVLISWRWLAAQLYFRPHGPSWRRHLDLEDFWTSNTVVLIHMDGLKRDQQRFQYNERSSSKMSIFSKLQSLPIKIFTKARSARMLLYLVLMLQLCVVLFSKVCGLLSHVIVGKFVYFWRKHLRKGDPVEPPEKYARILKCVCMPREDPSDLWEANQMAFNKVKLLIQKGCEKGRSCEEIRSIFCRYSVQWAEDGTQLLNILKETAISSVLEHFPGVENQSVKMTVVSLITIFTGLHKAKSDHLRNVLKACLEVWDLLSFADECDIDSQANKINLLDDIRKDKDQVCMAAEREFYKLQMEYDKLPSGCEDCVMDVGEARRFLQDLSQKCEGLLRKEKLLGDYKEEAATSLTDSKDWMEIAPSYMLDKLCNVMLHKDIEDFVAWTQESIKNVIASCVSRLPDMFVKQCWKWAEELKEDKLWEVSHLAGKCRGMMEVWDLKPKPTMNMTKQWTIQVMESTQLLADLELSF